jgi:hypothetical protein
MYYSLLFDILTTSFLINKYLSFKNYGFKRFYQKFC